MTGKCSRDKSARVPQAEIHAHRLLRLFSGKITIQSKHLRSQ